VLGDIYIWARELAKEFAPVIGVCQAGASGENKMWLDMNDVVKVLEEARNHFGGSKPIVILMHTLMGKGVDFMENDHNWHGVAPNDDQLSRALAQLPEKLGDY
jgi:transketolase